MRSFFYLLFSFASLLSIAQAAPETSIYLVPMEYKNGSITLGKPALTTPEKGYNNQPWFLPSNEGFLYSTNQGSGKTDIYLHHFGSGDNFKIIGTGSAAEYSPRTLPGKNQFAVVQVAPDDTTQQLMVYDFPGENGKLIWESQTKVGYFHFISTDMLAAFVLGDSFTLHLYNLTDDADTIVAGNIGRCFGTHPKTGELSYVYKGDNDSIWSIKGLKPSTLAQRNITYTLPYVEDYLWLDDGSLLMGKEGKLYHLIPGKDETWRMVGDLSSSVGDFYRLAISPNQQKLALVAFSGERP